MLTAPKDTLAYQLKGRPLLLNRDMRHVSCKAVSQQLAAFIAADKTGAGTHPETEALWFYLMNQGVAAVRKRFDLFEPLGSYRWVLDTYHQEVGPRVARAFYYLLVICTREARHLKNKHVLKDQLVAQFGPTIYDYLCTIPDDAGSAMQLFVKTAPEARFGDYCAALSYVFYKGSWASAFGGKKWGVISDTLLRFVNGETNGEMLLDTVWTLKHNTAPIFNKGMLYAHDNQSVMLRILDCQHAGMVPQALMTDSAVQQYANQALHETRSKLCDLLGSEFEGCVDWVKVAAEAKSGQNYNAEIAKAPKTPEQLAALKAQHEAAAKAAQEAKLAEEKAKVEAHSKTFTLWGFGNKKLETIKKIQIKRAA